MIFPAAYPHVKIKAPTISQSSSTGVKAFRYLAQNRPITANVASAVNTIVITIVLTPYSVNSFAAVAGIEGDGSAVGDMIQRKVKERQ
jgi:hypothetical protein